MILHAAARVLGCDSVQLLMVDEERRTLRFTTSITNRELPRLQAAERELGFQLDGAEMPLTVSSSTLVRSFHEERLFVTTSVAELAGDLIPAEVVENVTKAIGPRSFGVAPIIGRAGTIGVLVYEKQDESGFSPEDRDLLVSYADRVGADLESQVLSHDVERLERLEAVGRPPEVHVCNAQLVVTASPASPVLVGRPLWDALGVPEGPVMDALAMAGGGGGEGGAANGVATVTLRGSAGTHLRLTLVRAAADLVVAACEDLAESDRIRRESERARDHLAKVLHSVDDVILTLDAEGRVVEGNQAVRRALGYQAAELAGKSAIDLCADERSRKRVDEMRLHLRSSGFAEGELRLRRRDGRAIVAEVSALLLADDEERPAGVLWRIHDATERRRGEAERKRLRERLLQTERLSALGEMAARIAHEVRNPLVSIGAAAQVVAEELGEGSPVVEEARAIVREVRRLDGIVSDFLRFARPVQKDKRPVDLVPVVREAVELARKKPGSGGGAASEVSLTLGAPTLLVTCDPDGVKQVLLNVLWNAVEASPPGAPVECEARVLGDHVELTVADRGPGIPPALRSRVFDPFFSTKTRGTGLGLAISKQIVDEHRGRVRLLPRRGGGTRVVIHLPVDAH